MRINSKLVTDEEGNLKEADIKEAWNFDKKKDDDKEEKKDEKKDDKECECEEKDDGKKKWNFEKSSKEYSELESFISRIAVEKGIEDVSEISINLNKEAGIIEFKIANNLGVNLQEEDKKDYVDPEDKEEMGFSKDPDADII